MATKKKVSSSLNAPKKVTWLVSLILLIIGVVLFVMGQTGTSWGTVAGAVTMGLSSALLLLAAYIKGL